MRRKRIFIGSSGETKDALAEPIAGLLSEYHFKIERWWEVFKAGDITLQKLMHIAKEVDGAVFGLHPLTETGS
jgi:predicted nucleotide-binding protein